MDRQWNFWKVAFIPIYLVAAGALLYCNWDRLFYLQAHQSFEDLPRLYGCFAFALIGFAALAANNVLSKPDDMGFPWTYLWKFPFLCAFNATAVFAICQMFEKTNGYLFNFTAYPFAFVGGLFSEIALPLLFRKAVAWSES